MPTIPKLAPTVRDYLSSFGAVAIALTRKGSFVLTPSPGGFESAWWLKRAEGQRLLDAVREKGNVEATARTLGIAVTPHEIAIMRVDANLGRLETILATAKRNGDLKAFNRAYAARRQAALASGKTFMPYGTAERRLRRALTEAIANGCNGRVFAGAVAEVFDA